MALALLVLDCDGVILESVDVKTQAFAQVAEAFGAEARDRLIVFHRLHGGVSRREKFRWMVQEVLHREPTDAELDSLCQQFSQATLDQMLRVPLVPGIQEVLDAYKGKVPIYVCSGTPQEELQRILELRGLTQYFTGIVGTPPAKAELLKRIVREAKVDPADAVMVGDASTDQLAAEAAETKFYGRGSFFQGTGHPWGEDLTGLLGWLQEM